MEKRIETKIRCSVSSISVPASSRLTTDFFGDVDNDGGDMDLDNDTVGGDLRSEGGDTTLNDTNVFGDTDLDDLDDVDGLDFTVGGKSTIRGITTIQNLVASSAANMLCSSTVQGSLRLLSNAAPVTIGQGSGCPGNKITGIVQIENNTAPVTIVGNTITGILQCSGKTSISGSGNTVLGAELGQCAGF